MALTFVATSRTVLALLAVSTVTARIPLTAKLTKLSCTIYDKVLVRNFDCSTRPINRNKTVVNILGHLNSQVDDIMAHVILYKMVNVFKPFLVNVKENFCQMIAGKLSMIYLRILYRIMEPYTNFNHSCPYNGDIIFKDMDVDLNRIREIRDAWPPGRYRLDMLIYFNKAASPTLKMVYEAIYEEKYLIGK